MVIIRFLTILFFLALPLAAHANVTKVSDFQPLHSEEGMDMQLLGTCTKKILFMDLFVAGFYLDKDVERARPLDDVGKRVEISYFKSVSAKRFIDFIEKRMEKNMSPQEFQEVEDRIRTLDTMFVDLKGGDLFTMTYIPDSGTRFEHNGRILGTVAGADFGKGIFATWVGDKPFDHSVKRQVLGLDSLAQ